jgi:hypothetical protein
MKDLIQVLLKYSEVTVPLLVVSIPWVFMAGMVWRSLLAMRETLVEISKNTAVMRDEIVEQSSRLTVIENRCTEREKWLCKLERRIEALQDREVGS